MNRIQVKLDNWQDMINWKKIDTVLLDMDGTLLDLHFDNHFWLVHLPRRYAETKAIPLQQAHRHLMSLIDAQRGQLNWYCLDFWSEQLNLDIVSLKEEVQHLIQFRPQVESFLQHLKDSRLKTILVTNAHRKSLELKQRHTRIEQYFDKVVSAHDFKVPKENPKFWYELSAMLPFKPASTLLIDDSLPVLQSAREFGVGHLLTVMRPDSQQKPRDSHQIHDFPAIHDFDQLQSASIGRT